jgi:membrane associated rhomboid family serine protease
MATATCYRHPDRETRVSCSNCGRPICPDCMTTTPVGMRCPECARQRTKVKTGAAAFGRSNAAPATYVLIGLNVVGFLAEVASGAGGLSSGGTVVNDFGLSGPAVANGEWYRLISSGFLHFGPLHLLFNMYLLYVLGTLLEPAIGTVRFVALYVASLLAGSFGALLFTPDSLSAGASGAVFGLIAAAFVISWGRGVNQIAGQLGFLIVINIAFTFGVSGISIGAHVFGALCGLIVGLVMAAGDRGMLGANRFTAEVALCSVIAIASALAAVSIA